MGLFERAKAASGASGARAAWWRRLVTIALLAAVVAAAVWSVRSGDALGKVSQPLQTPAAPDRMQSLQLAPTDAAARAILTGWNERGLVDDAQAALVLDDRFILAYVALGVALALLATAFARAPWWVAAIVVSFVVLGGASDRLENRYLAAQLDNPSSPDAGAVVRARSWAMTKFVCLLFGAVPTLVLFGGGVRRWLVERSGGATASGAGAARTSDRCEVRQFRALIEAENRCVFSDASRRPADSLKIADNVNTDEPRVQFRSADITALALSGGGIRSATFNLGILQALHQRGLLPLIDYVATVSGGGYTGAFWSAWLAKQLSTTCSLAEGTPSPLFPQAPPAGPGLSDGVDADPVRHLREFSKFLAPRWGFFEVETWRALVAVVSGLVPALVMALSLIGLALVSWLSLTFPLAFQTPRAGVYIVVTLTLITLVVFEVMWQTLKAESSGGRDWRGWKRYAAISAVTLGLVGLAQWYAWTAYRAAGSPDLWFYRNDGISTHISLDAEFRLWWVLVGLEPNIRLVYWTLSPHVFDYGIVWLAVSLLLVALRLTFPLAVRPWAPETLSAFDRVLMRVLALSVIWFILGAVWHVVINSVQGIRWIAAAAVASGGIFAALRNWIAVAVRPPKTSGVMAALKPYVPQALAYLTIVLAAAVVGNVLAAVAANDWFTWYGASGALAGVVALGLFIDPAEFGMHAFYRDRLTRAFTGASNTEAGPAASDNRVTEPRAGDDLPLPDLPNRPLHLVCCAANDLSGDTIQTLGRGSRSAVLSKKGFSMGRFWSPSTLTLGSAITASAAAFNSNMGSLSVELGPAVSFLMTALNLRLGLWVRHPAAEAADARRWPGVLLYREMFSLTSSSGPVALVEGGGADVPRLMRDVHLSDGGHFENLALYELIRRHCRYVLLCDCGQDQTVSFDDLGNALRRIREDFGVDITIDVSPLRPGPNRQARQHVAVGWIHYSETDRGILLYIKPALTGNEPPDVLQYSTRNTAFPHESTGDQFYDEAQYESYRRLGFHAADEIFSFVPPAADPASGHLERSRPAAAQQGDVTADWLFVQATHVWGATPPDLAANVLAMTNRLREIEEEFRRSPNNPLVCEVFPELGFTAAAVAGTTNGAGDGTVVASPEVLSVVLRMTQVMEDVWIACQLDEWWDHPLNLGWVNLFARWATAPSYRFWWPAISPMYSPEFRAFIDGRFPVPGPPDDVYKRLSNVRIPQRGRLTPLAPDAPDGLAAMWWKQRSTQPRRWAGRTLYQNLVDLPVNDAVGVPLQVGIVAVTTIGDNVGWTSDDFFVPPSLWGASMGWYFLDNLLNALNDASGGASTVYVVVKAVPPEIQHKVAFDDRVAFMEQYRKIGFRRHLNPAADHSDALDQEILTALGFTSADTLFTLQLRAWAAQRGRYRR